MVAARKQLIYVETSVWNFEFADDAPQHQHATQRFFELARQGHFNLCVSELVTRELEAAPEPRRSELLGLLAELQPTLFPVDEEALGLAADYMRNEMVPPKYANDAMHIAVAVARDVDMLLSWNFKHIVKVKTRRVVNATSRIAGYKEIEICTPEEVIYDDDET